MPERRFIEKVVDRIPFLRLFIPLITGIIIEYHVKLSFITIFGLFAAGVILLFTVELMPSLRKRYNYNYLGGIAIFVLICTLGMYALYFTEKKLQPPTEVNLHPYVIAEIKNSPLPKPKSFLLNAEVVAYADSSGRKKAANKTYPVVLYMQPSSFVQKLTPGDILIFKNRLSPIQNSGNPESFDYVGYMQMDGIGFSQYLAGGQWRKIGHNSVLSLKQRADKTRQNILLRLDRLDIPAKESAILKSLLLGYKADLSEDQKTAFSEAGLSHVLAISGLHTGIIIYLLFIAFYPLQMMGHNKLKYGFIILVLWCYAYITGLSPSVTRAAIMASFFLFAKMINRKNVSLNTLFAAAFFMLLYNPYNLYNISFQLSFIAVLFICSLLPTIERLYMPKHRIIRYVYVTLVITLSVQAGTTIVCAYYFHIIPVYSILSNIIIIPMLPILLGVAIISLLLSYAGLPLSWFTTIVEYMLAAIDGVTNYVRQLPGAVIRNISVEPFELFYYFLFVSVLLFFIKTRKGKYGIAILCVLFMFIISKIVHKELTKPIESALVVYNQTDGAFLNIIEQKKNYIIPVDSLIDDNKRDRAAQNFWIKNGFYEPELIDCDTILPDLKISYPFCLYKNKRILILNSDFWNNKITERPLTIDYCIIGQYYKGDFSKTSELFNFKHIIITPEVSVPRARKIERICNARQISCRLVRYEGAFLEIVK